MIANQLLFTDLHAFCAEDILLNEEQCTEVKEPDNLYAQSCVLMDGKTGRILFEKNGYDIMPMASTTKIMTLIVALENCNLQDVVTVSDYGANQPKVHLGMHTGQQFLLKDLCYSLMLESHNDSAVVIAEHIGSQKLNLSETTERTKEESKAAVKAFTDMMNEKARDIGCFHTFFVTPNGLDADALLGNGQQKSHGTTAAELAKIMSYCINTSDKKDVFLEITRMASYGFTDVLGEKTYDCTNRNAFLSMMEGALTGKTGFTNKAGYCYVGALERDGKLFIVSLLACGWPNNRSYKWDDTKKLMEYGLENYNYKEVFEKKNDFEPVLVDGGMAKIGKHAYVIPELQEQCLEILMNEQEQIRIVYDISKKIEAPVKKGEKIGTATYYIKDEQIAVFPLLSNCSIEKKTYKKCFRQILDLFFEKV